MPVSTSLEKRICLWIKSKNKAPDQWPGALFLLLNKLIMVTVFSPTHKGMVRSPVSTMFSLYVFTVFITNNIAATRAYSATNKGTAYTMANQATGNCTTGTTNNSSATLVAQFFMLCLACITKCQYTKY
jgi:hypothetical protein